MKPSQLAAAFVAATAFTLSAQAGVDVGVSVQISQPGVYGRIDIGRYPQPQVIVQQPVWVARPVQPPPMQPIYMWVPPGHQKHWSKHCARYGACGAPVYFVQDSWYHQHVTGPQHGKGHGRGRDRDRDDDRGHGHGKGKGHDKRD
jgi:hypothetical protein